MVRPRTTSLPPDEMIELGKEMLIWVKKNDPIHLNEWYSLEKQFVYNQWKKFIEKEEFRPYYEQCINIIGRHYIKKESKIEPSIKQRFLRIYFRDVKEEEDSTAKYNSELKKTENSDIPPLTDMVDKDNQIMELKAKIAKLENKN